MKAQLKNSLRSFKKNLTRFFAVSAIIFLGASFVSGLGTLPKTVRNSFSKYLIENKTADIVLKSKSDSGFLDGQLDFFNSVQGIDAVQAFSSFELSIDDKLSRIYVMPLREMKLNTLTLSKGDFPSSNDEILIDRASLDVTADIGGTLNVLGMERTISGIAENPLHLIKDGEPDLNGDNELELIIYIDSEFFPYPMPITDVYLSIDNADGLNKYSNAYQNRIDSLVEFFSDYDEDYACLTLNENKGYKMLDEYCDKIFILSLIFPAFFIAVASLTALSAVTRLIEEERPSLGCLKTLGFSNFKILRRYLISFSLSCIIASVAGIAVGLRILPAVIYPTFNITFFLPPISSSFDIIPGAIAFAGMLFSVMAVTLYASLKELKGAPADILRAKAPKAGKKIFLERLPFLWQPLAFRFKSAFRNIFRYINHFIMTIVSVAGSSALVLAGFALLDVSNTSVNGIRGDYGKLFAPISAVVIVFAILLCGFVLFNLTSMNISERKREIATLKVLGYHAKETAWYIYREIIIMSLIGVILGIPLGLGLIVFILKFLDFGAVSDIKWYSFFIAASVVITFALTLCLLFWRKINSIDMTTSLKSVD